MPCKTYVAEAVNRKSWCILAMLFLIARPNVATAGDWRPYVNRYAIIVMSDGRNSDKYFWPVTRSMYQSLRTIGFAKENIRFLAPRKYVTNYPDIVFGEASEPKIKQTYEWAKSVCTSEDLLYIFWISHGKSSAFTTAGNPVKHSTLSTWMEGIKARQIIGVYQPCQSGAVIDDISGRNIITTTSTDLTAGNNWPWAENMAFALAGPPYCEQWMNPNHELEPAKYPADQDGDGRVSITEAYIWVAKHRYTEGSMFDDNGDGVGGQWAQDTFDPTDPDKDGYRGHHYSLRSWKPIGTVAPAPAETPAQRDARMQWWREARFGMFVHWGLYSGLAGTWKDKPVGKRGGMEWIQQRVGADTWDYAHEAVPLFRPKEGFADEWAKLAREAGCRYVVFTTKHHDGFCLFDSQYTTYDAHDLIGRDLCKEIVNAVRNEGLKVGFYHSVIDWHHPQYDYFKADQLPHPLKGKPSPNGPRHHDIYVDYLHAQARELFSNYGPVDIIWWDYSKEGNEGTFWRANELMAMARNLQPGIISNNRLYHIPHIEKDDSVDRLRTWKPEQGDFTTPEQTIPSTGISGVDWEVCMTMNTTWGYSQHDQAWKANETLIRNLVDIVSKGGNYLLNIGPKGDGSIPIESIESMHAIGRWMATNGEAIYGTTASPFERPAWGRYTTKPGKLYAHVFEWPQNGMLRVPAGELRVKRVYLLADPNRTKLKTEKKSDTLILRLPQNAPDDIASLIVIEHDQ